MILALVLLLQEASSKIAEEIEVANAKDRPQLHAVAARRLKERGAAAVADEVARFVERKGRNALSIGFTETLGELKDPRIAKLLRGLAGDPGFFWRPAAMRALAEHADAESLEVFRRALTDRLWGCRAAAIHGLERLGDRESIPKIGGLLGDEIYDVRARAAKTLHAFGDESGLPVLVASLRARARWFDIDYGQIAREDAWNFLKKLTGDGFGYKPWETETERAPGLAKFEAWIAKKFPDWRERVPEKARSRTDEAEYVFGFELRSCRRGDYFFRIDREGNLVLGYFNLVKAKLTADELGRFEAALEKVKGVDRRVPYGQGGCDFEQYLLRVGNGFEKLWVGIDGRPPEIEAWNRTMQALLREKFGESEAEEFRETSKIFRGVE